MDFEGLFSVDMCDLSNMAAASQANPIEEENTDPSQWANQDDLNLDDNNTTGGVSDETRTRLDECQNELDRLNNEKASMDAQLAQMNNPALRVNLSRSPLRAEHVLSLCRIFSSHASIPSKPKSNVPRWT